MRFQRFIPILVALCISLSPAAASAQTDEEFFLTLLLGLYFGPVAVGTTVAGVTTTGGAVVGVLLTNNVEEPKDTPEVRAYLRENQHHLLQDMAVGGGDTLSDLATLFGVSPVYLPLFERALIMERVRLTVLLSGDDVSMGDTRAFIDVLATRIASELEEGTGEPTTYQQKMRGTH